MKKPRILLAHFVLFSAIAPSALADYPIASHRYLANPSSLVAKDRVYIYCSNDDESPVGCSYNIPNVICVSSSDMISLDGEVSGVETEPCSKGGMNLAELKMTTGLRLLVLFLATRAPRHS